MIEHDHTLDGAVDIIDNELEYFSFFPIRFICYTFSLLALYLIIIGLIADAPIVIALIGIMFLIITLPIAIV